MTSPPQSTVSTILIDTCKRCTLAVAITADPLLWSAMLSASTAALPPSIVAPESLLPLPDDISIDDGVFLANMETAVYLLMDGRPLIGERVVVLGLGTIGLLVTALLSRFPLEALMGIDPHRIRRDAAADFGATDLFSGKEADLAVQPASITEESDSNGRADLIYEVSGNPDALNVALGLAGYHTRLVNSVVFTYA